LSDIQIIGDPNSGGGTIDIPTQNFCRITGLLIAVNGTLVTSHPPCPIVPIHCEGNYVTESRQGFARINGLPISIDGDGDTCGHSRLPNGRGYRINP